MTRFLFKIISTIGAVIILQSCATNNLREESISDILTLNSENSIIITRINISRKTWSNNYLDANYGNIIWCKKNQTKQCEDSFSMKIDASKKADKPYQIYNINSGFFYLDAIKQIRPALIPVYFIGSILTLTAVNSPSFNTSISGWDKNSDAVNFTSFNTNAGEIVYIGDINFEIAHQKHWIRGKINLEVEDNYADAVKYFYEKHPEFKNKKVIKRLAQPGVLLDNYDAGIFW